MLIGMCCSEAATPPASANPIVLNANTSTGSAAPVRPLLPPDTFDDSEAEDAGTGDAKRYPAAPQQANVRSQQAPKAPRRGSSISVQTRHEPGIDTISVRPMVAAPKFTVERLDNPPRIVVDIEASTAGASRTMPAAGLDYVSGIRIGAHPGKSRVVLDLVRAGHVRHQAALMNGEIVVVLKDDAGSAAPLQEAGSPAGGSDAEEARDELAEDAALEGKRAEAESDDEVLPEPALAQGETDSDIDLDAEKGLQVAKDHDEQVEAVLASIERGQEKVSGLEVTSLSLEKGDSAAPEVRIEVSGKPIYNLQRTAPSEYVLAIAKAALGGTIKREPLLADPKSTTIRSVRVTEGASGVFVRIFSQPNTYLTARRERDEIVISETQDLRQVVKDIRAQLAPPGKDAQPAPAKAEAPKSPPPPPALPATVEDLPPTKPNLPPDTKKGEKAAAADTAKQDTKKQAASRAKGAKTKTEISDADIDALLGDKAKYTGRLISLDLQDTDIDNALRIIAEVSNLNIVASEDVKGKVTLRLLDVPWDQALDVILKTNGLDKVVEGSVMRIAPIEKLKVERENLKQAQVAEEELEPLAVKYLRVSYAKAGEIKSLVDTVISERGSVAYDERSNQLIVKDVRAGLKNVVELVSKVDLRTPQVLLETQIVEATRNLTRELGSELGFQYIQSPSTGNGTGNNFPSAVSVGGSVSPNSIVGSAFPVAASLAEGSAVSMLFDSADGTKSLELRLSQLEQEGKVRIISRPAVATTNNKAAEIKSVEKFRVKLPNGGLSVATGAGASASGTSNTATEVIEAGITLNVIPQASPDYFILLDIKARSSTFGNKEVEGIPNEFERAASSTVLVSSGQTFALGGIYKVTELDRVTGVPFFKDIPVIGTFFRRTKTDDSDEELLFFITPRIVEGSFDDSTMKAVS